VFRHCIGFNSIGSNEFGAGGPTECTRRSAARLSSGGDPEAEMAVHLSELHADIAAPGRRRPSRRSAFDDNPRRSGLAFAVHIWNPIGPDPDSLWKVMSRQKDLQYSSRAASHIARQKQIHKLRHVIAELAARSGPQRSGGYPAANPDRQHRESRLRRLDLLHPHQESRAVKSSDQNRRQSQISVVARPGFEPATAFIVGVIVISGAERSGWNADPYPHFLWVR
jgi:hypothetical protein